jgi:glycerophosphoryl diester phosphodiesterase
MQTMPAVTAHRGWHADGAPKNSIAALERASTGGADMVENDLRQLGDGTIIVHHDDHIGGVPLDQLDRSILDANPQIPTLERWAQRAGELGMTGLIEVKDPGFEREAVEILRRHMPDEHLNFFSFHPAVTKQLRSIVPNRPIGLLSDLQSPALSGAQLVRNAVDARASFVGLNVRQSSNVVLQAVHDANLGATVWTVKTPADHARLLAHPLVTSVISDMPQVATKIRSTIYRNAATAAVRVLHA